MKNTILSLNHQQALNFFLGHENYFDVSLPIYFNISQLLQKISEVNIKNTQTLFTNIKSDKTHLILYTPKPNGDKRPLTMVNPVLHVMLAKQLTNQDTWYDFIKLFDFYKIQDNISCHSLPIVSNYSKFAKYKAKQIMNWYDNFEQASIKLSLHYDYIAISDIQNFYPSITKRTLEQSLSTNHKNQLGKFKNLCNQFLDTYHEKGLPQGNSIFHLLADTVLLNVDKSLHQKITHYNITNYKILRYRDDYHIFTNCKKGAEIILTLLKETLYSLDLEFNDNKTNICNDVITNSLKSDKLVWLKYEPLINKNNQTIPTSKILLLIKEYSDEFPNSSGVQRGLTIVYKKLKNEINFVDKNHIPQIIAITLDIAKNNPRWTANCLQIIGILSSKLNNNQQHELIKITHKKLIHENADFSVILWVQRFIYSIDKNLLNLPFDNILSQYFYHQDNHQLWDFSFIKNKSIKDTLKQPITNVQLIDNEHRCLSDKEVNLFYKTKINQLL